MELQDLAVLIEGSQRSAFRLETLPTYLVPQEAAEFAAWRAGRPEPLQTPETSPWLDKIRRTTWAGYRWSRVHVVDHPLAEYTRFELHGYRANASAGEDIRIADRRAHCDLAGLTRDFWLVDDQTLISMARVMADLVDRTGLIRGSRWTTDDQDDRNIEERLPAERLHQPAAGHVARGPCHLRRDRCSHRRQPRPRHPPAGLLHLRGRTDPRPITTCQHSFPMGGRATRHLHPVGAGQHPPGGFDR